MTKSGKNNGLTDVEGIMVGHYTSLSAASGVTVILCKAGAVGGVDVRGSAPGTGEQTYLRRSIWWKKFKELCCVVVPCSDCQQPTEWLHGLRS